MVIKINYTSSDVYVSTSVSPVYVVVNYSGVSGGGAVWGEITGTLSNQTDLQDALDAKVPYTGATANVDLGEFGLSAGQVEFDQTPTGTAGVGVMRWNDSDGTLDLGLKGGNVTLQVGQEQILRVVNKTGADLLESQYRAVRIRLASEGGSQGQRLAVVLAQGNSDANSTDTIGIVTETITNNQEGFICTSGLVREINTTGSLQGETWVDGDVIYLSPTTAGAITNIKPVAPQHTVILGYVVYAHAIHGKIFVKCDNGYELDELHNVLISSPSNNDALIYESSSQLWKNKTIATALGYTPVPTTRTLTINGTAYDLSADRSWTVSGGGTTIYSGDGTLAGNRTVTMGSYTLSFEKDVLVNGITVGLGFSGISTNTAVGNSSLSVATTGIRNTAVGSTAGQSCTSSDNTIVGANSGNNASFSGGLNTLMGSFSGQNITSGSRNVAIGHVTGRNIGSGVSNTYIGTATVQGGNGSWNVAIGDVSCEGNSTASYNATVGSYSMQKNTTGNYNVALGTNAGSSITGGADNAITNNSVYIGAGTRALASNQTNQIVIGYNSTGLGSNTTVIGNSSTTDTAIYGRMLVNYSSPVIGTYALDVNGTARVTGDASVNGLTIGKGGGNVSSNTALGGAALTSNTTGFDNSAFGSQSLRNLTTGLFCSAFGSGALQTFITGTHNSAFGYVSLYSSVGSRNSAFGSASFYSLSSGNDNTALGNNAGRYIAGGATANTTSSTSIFIGSDTKALADSQVNQIVIGYNETGLGSNTTIIGTASTITTALRGRLLLGTTTDSGSYQLDVNGTARVSGLLTTSAGVVGTYANFSGNAAFGSTTQIAIGGSGGFGGGASYWLQAVSNNFTINVTANAASSVEFIASGSPLNSYTGYNNALSQRNVTMGYSAGLTAYYNQYKSVLNATGNASVNTMYVRGYFVDSGTLTPNSTTIIPIGFENVSGSNLFNSTSGSTLFGGQYASLVASAKVQIDSSTQGFLPPRMTNAQRSAISSPAVGLIVYCTDATEGLYEYTSAGWVNLNGVVTNRQTASYTLALTDVNDLVEMNVATANNLTVPLNSSIAFPIGTKIDIAQYGAGQTIVVATGGVTIRSAGGALKLAAQYSGGSLVKIGTDEWYLFGDITV